MGRRVEGDSQKQQRRPDWLLHFCFTALAAGAVIGLGHWFGSSRGRYLGGDKGRLPKGNTVAKGDCKNDSQKRSNDTESMSLDELRQRRLMAVDARLHSSRNGPSMTNLTPFGKILKLAQQVDTLEKETLSFLQKVSITKAMDDLDEKEYVRLTELLTSLQIEIDSIPSDECARPHRKQRTNQIQNLLGKLDQVKNCEISAGTVSFEVGSTLS
ncbi:hypothetical protein KP509_26G005000 [Ceratopteris richardii]|uniref:BAG domain-containing protein n=1 Tax=Ceratopteris richardii TaxID=49495 RepID=A0A8T2RI00_CERRI|nr:hypothetical protein KP509_26G005000 [Ceratopteris richardii]